MSNDTLTYVTEEMRSAQGKWGGTRTAPPITKTDIRRWAMATYYPQQPPRIYWDADHASTAAPSVPTILDADSHLMELPDFLSRHVERSMRDRIPDQARFFAGNFRNLFGAGNGVAA